MFGFMIVLPMFAAIGTLVGAVFLRCSVALANKFITPSTPTAEVVEPPRTPPQLPAGQSDPANPFAAPMTAPKIEIDPQAKDGIPDPSFLKAVSICLLFMITHVVITLAMAFLVNPGSLRYSWLLNLSVLVLDALVGVALIKAQLPTTWKRAILVTFFFALIAIVSAIILGAAIALLA